MTTGIPHLCVCICTYKRLPFLKRLLTELAAQETDDLFTYSVVVADNVKLPGAPAYRAYMREQQGKTWRTVEHDTHVEYQTLLKDLVLESEYLG